MYGMVYFTTEKMIEERPDVVRRYLSAVIRGWQWAMANRDEAATLVLKRDPSLTFETQRAMLDRIEPILGERIGNMSLARWEATAQVLVAAGLIDEAPDVRAAFDSSFIMAIMNERG